ncbi:MAG: hypothetical protein JSV09_07910 [Thermoplasmata archaeon]|nr:MAG: hypothetical protein JSV09_07910 [Thermoplasmata archaeon]
MNYLRNLYSEGIRLLLEDPNNPFNMLSNYIADTLRKNGVEVKVIKYGDPDWNNEYVTPENYFYLKLNDCDISQVIFKTGRASYYGSEYDIKSESLILQIHYIVIKNPTPVPGLYKAKIKKKTPGFSNREITNLEWKGGKLAQLLSNDVITTQKILTSLGPNDRISVSPDTKRRYVRIIHKTRVTIKKGDDVYNIIKACFSASLFEGIEGVARHVVNLI